MEMPIIPVRTFSDFGTGVIYREAYKKVLRARKYDFESISNGNGTTTVKLK